MFRSVMYFGTGSRNVVVYTNDGLTYGTIGEIDLTNVSDGYHCEIVLVGTHIHLFY